MATQMKAIVIVVLSTIFTSTGSACYKVGADLIRAGILINLPLFLGALLYILSAGLLILGLKWGELSVLYPIYGLNYVWVSLISIYFFHEIIKLIQWTGIAAIIIGVVFIGIGSNGVGRYGN